MFGVGRKYRGHHETDAFDPKPDMARGAASRSIPVNGQGKWTPLN
jgi:hypothetical protein